MLIVTKNESYYTPISNFRAQKSIKLNSIFVKFTSLFVLVISHLSIHVLLMFYNFAKAISSKENSKSTLLNGLSKKYFRMKEITRAGETLRFVAQMMAENEHIFAYQ